MAALVLEAYGALCFFASAVFFAWAAVAKLRPDLDEDEFDFIEAEKLKQLVSSEQSGDALSIEPAIIEESSWSAASPSGRAERAADPKTLTPVHTCSARTICF